MIAASTPDGFHDPAPLETSVRTMEGETVVAVSGEVDIATVGQLRDVLAAQDAADLVVDLADVTFMDTSGLRLLVERQRAAEDAGARFAIARPHKLVRHLLDIAGLTDRLDIRDDEPASDVGGAG